MNFLTCLFVFFFLFSTVHAAETETRIVLPPVTVSGNATFDTLSEESYVPSQKASVEDNRPETLDTLTKRTAYPVKNTGYPSGATTVNLGGLSTNDTQVYTLGVPLNLPQGGGADLSFFPAYLWSDVLISPTQSATGFSPQAASGSVQLKLWTREELRKKRSQAHDARVTGSYDRQLQTFSLASHKEDVAILAGMSFNGMEGPAGSLSYRILEANGHHLYFHFLGSDQKGPSPGSIVFPTPNTKKHSWRVIPVLESAEELTPDFIVETTVYGDLQSLTFEDPTMPSDQRTQQYGVENAILVGPYTFATSIRYTRFTISGAGKAVEWPMYVSASREWFLSPEWSARTTIGAVYTENPGLNFRGSIGAKLQLNPHQFYFSELSTTPKYPTLVDRFGVYTGFVGNPNLRVERVNALLLGYQTTKNEISSTTTLKGETRSDIQVLGATTINAGRAHLVSLNQQLKTPLGSNWAIESNTLLTYSRIERSGFTYPDLPYATEQGILSFLPNDSLTLNADGRFSSNSIAYNGRLHTSYFLSDFWAVYALNREIELTAGVDNLFDNRAQPILDYPLPGRIVYLSARAYF